MFYDPEQLTRAAGTLETDSKTCTLAGPLLAAWTDKPQQPGVGEGRYLDGRKECHS